MRIDRDVLLHWQQLDAAVVLAAIADYAKEDKTFGPTKARTTSRWHASLNGNEFELLLTGQKFWDVRAKTGGGGAVDLVMHLAGLDFTLAIRRLRELQL